MVFRREACRAPVSQFGEAEFTQQVLGDGLVAAPRPRTVAGAAQRVSAEVGGQQCSRWIHNELTDARRTTDRRHS